MGSNEASRQIETRLIPPPEPVALEFSDARDAVAVHIDGAATAITGPGQFLRWSRVAVWLLSFGLTAGCSDSSQWHIQTDPITDGVNFRDTLSVGNEIFALGTRAAQEDSVVLRYDGAAWTSLDDGTELPPLTAIWASGGDDVWAAGDEFWHWDGAWTQVGLADAVGVADYVVTDVWGTGADDVWAAAWFFTENGTSTAVVRWDGTAWAEIPGLDVFAPPTKGSDVAYFAVNHGCSRADGEVVVTTSATFSLANFGESFQWDGTGWRESARSPAGSEDARFTALSCGDHDAWALGWAAPSDFVARLEDSVWSNAFFARRDIRLRAIATGPTGTWIAGGECVDDDCNELDPRVFCLLCEDAKSDLPDDLDPGPNPLTAVSLTEDGAVWVFGDDGLVIRRDP